MGNRADSGGAKQPRRVGRLTRRLAAVSEGVLSPLPPGLRRPLRRLLWLPVDLVEGWIGARLPTVPPRGLRDVGAGDFVAVGDGIARLLEEHCGLAPESRVLDVGCGIGRVARALTAVVTPPGSHLGFDVSRTDIRWCRSHLGRRFPAFSFVHADVRNPVYNPRGRVEPTNFSFPCADSSVDVVVATSLFTHLLDAAAARYMSEVARVLRPGGRCLATFFLLCDESRALSARGLGGHRFPSRVGDAWVADVARPEAAVAYEEDLLRSFCAQVGLEVVEPVLWGAWCGREGVSDYQDTVILGRAL